MGPGCPGGPGAPPIPGRPLSPAWPLSPFIPYRGKKRKKFRLFTLLTAGKYFNRVLFHLISPTQTNNVLFIMHYFHKTFRLSVVML